ncbi:MAG: MotA/TolQ/ExbB proton channel family protein [Treponema sp.]|jgi:chemotaxis protein MotA|nr:MotA/TolQ/ExbB proton channel family protein [Treponema sp.]
MNKSGVNVSTWIGAIGAMVMVLGSIVVSGGDVMNFVDIPSLMLVLIGSYFSLWVAFNQKDAIGVFSAIGLTFKLPVYNQQGIIQKLISFSEKARREGLLALEDELEDLDDEFMKKGLRLVVDGTDATIIRDLMELELSQMNSRHALKIKGISMWSALSPGLGMLGTVMGLVAMLANMEDKSSIGPNMALALITTFYGSLFSNVYFLSWACKLQVFDADESSVKEMIIEGVLSIQSGDNTRILAMKLLAYLDPVTRIAMEKEVLKD